MVRDGSGYFTLENSKVFLAPNIPYLEIAKQANFIKIQYK
jgi:hypothetical protein